MNEFSHSHNYWLSCLRADGGWEFYWHRMIRGKNVLCLLFQKLLNVGCGCLRKLVPKSFVVMRYFWPNWPQQKYISQSEKIVLKIFVSNRKCLSKGLIKNLYLAWTHALSILSISISVPTYAPPLFNRGFVYYNNIKSSKSSVSN